MFNIFNTKHRQAVREAREAQEAKQVEETKQTLRAFAEKSKPLLIAAGWTVFDHADFLVGLNQIELTVYSPGHRLYTFRINTSGGWRFTAV